MKIPDTAADLSPSGLYEFGEFRVDAAKRVLKRRDGSPVPLTPKVFDTLLFLVQHAGTVLDKERLMEAVWPDSIVEENNLNKNISILRRVFGETPGSHRYIVTVPGRGYRFVADVSVATRPEQARSEPIPPAPIEQTQVPSPRPPLRKGLLVAIVAILLLLFAGLGWWQGSATSKSASDFPREIGVAVLPFENLSTDGGDAFFADGIQDDILTSVGRIKGLKVIARASVMDYRGARLAGKVREIGSALSVSHVLAGSVRRAGERVVINVALIDTRDERQVWSERYERTLSDSLSLQGELAVEVARALRTKLTPAETTLVSVGSTQNPEAYLHYLRAREIEIAAVDTALQPAVTSYQQAIDLDPAFALARARLSLCASRLLYSGVSGDWKAKARAEAEEALRLQPQLGEAHLALAHYLLWGESDYDRALGEVARSAELLPNSAEVPLTAAFILKRQNRHRERLQALRRAETLDPRNRRVLGYLITTLRWVREWREALAASDRLAAISPDGLTPAALWARANDRFRLTGNPRELTNTASTSSGSQSDADWRHLANYETAVLERDFTRAASHFAAISDGFFTDPGANRRPQSRSFDEALLAIGNESDRPAIDRALHRVRDEIETRLSSGGPAGVDDPRRELALVYAFLGRKEDAINLARDAIEQQLGPDGSIERNDASGVLALVYARSGEPEKAIELIEHLLRQPAQVQAGAVSNITLADLKLRWQWDPLRSHPRFQNILTGPEPQTSY